MRHSITISEKKQKKSVGGTCPRNHGCVSVPIQHILMDMLVHLEGEGRQTL